MYGGSTITDGNSPNLTFPFLHYNPEINAWKTFPLLPSNTYSSRTKIVNLGNDSIWIWGGRLYSSKNLYSADFGIFNYKSESWANVFPDTGAIKADHTATLGSNGLIYIIGGYYKANATADSSLSQFSRMFSFDTRSLSWGSIDAKGRVPSDRGLHTTTATADGKYFLIYGGAVIITSGLLVSEDVYYVYDISNNFFTEVPLPKNELSNNRNNARYGHFATLYNSTYLILSFGYNDATVPAESLSILNIVDPTKPVWATALSEPDTPKDNGGGGNGPDSKILIPAIVVPVVVVLLGAAIGLFFFIRHRKQQRKKAFVLEQEDPRKKNTNPLDFTDPSTEIATTVANSNSLGKQSIEITKPFMMEEYDYQTTTFKSNNSHVSNTSYQQQHQQNWSTGIDHTNIDSTKPFDAGQ
ncbi:hypothetical protein BJ944DRAFT_261349 [Cunninghamella echinulata]|nr:hypothetical protein BJ944DRAFT_261349 [Cunninghamella echinulata]